MSRPVSVQQVAPASRWPRRCAQVATASPASAVTAAAASHQGRAATRVPASRAAAPASDWLDGLAGFPIRDWS